jgi:hypothetical protein
MRTTLEWERATKAGRLSFYHMGFINCYIGDVPALVIDWTTRNDYTILAACIKRIYKIANSFNHLVLAVEPAQLSYRSCVYI